VLAALLLSPILVGLYIAANIGLTIYFLDLGVPPIAQELSSKEFETREKIFAERVTAAFPVGMPERELIKILGEQGFKVDGNERAAEFSKPYIGCEVHWRIRWQIDDANGLSSVSSSYGGICM